MTQFKSDIREEILAESSTSRKEQENKKIFVDCLKAALKAAFHNIKSTTSVHFRTENIFQNKGKGNSSPISSSSRATCRGA